MQLSLALPGPSLIADIDQRLHDIYGSPPDFLRFDPLSQLIQGVISARTEEDIASEAFLAVARRFGAPDWVALRDAAPAAILPLIAQVHHPEIKAAQLPEALQMIQARRGSLALEFLASWPTEAARRWLMALPGVGLKVSAATLNFSVIDGRVLVCDTHSLRVAARVGLVPAGVSAPKTYRMIERQIPDGWDAAQLNDHHWRMKTHGQRRCVHTAPLCTGCGLGDLCRDRAASQAARAG